MIGISGLGILSLFLLKEVEMRGHTDDSFGLAKNVESESTEKV